MRVSRFDLIPLMLIAIIAILVLYPGGSLIYGTFWSTYPGSPGNYTLDNWSEAFSTTFPKPLPILLLNTVAFAASVGFIAVLLGITLAYLVVRTNMPRGSMFEYLSMLPRAFPALIAAIAWGLILSSRLGIVNLFTRQYFGFTLFEIYSFPGMVFLLVLYEVPVVFLISINTFRLMDPSFEEQSLICGGSGLRTFFRVTLPMIRPLIFSAFILVFLIGMITVEIPILIGMPGNVYVLNSAIFFLLRAEYLRPEYNLATALAGTVLFYTIALLYFYRRSVRATARYVTIAGKATAARVHDLGRWRYVALTVFVLYFLVTMVFPVIIIVFLSFSQFFAQPSLEALSMFSLRWWIRVFEDDMFHRAIWNSLFLASVGATLNVSLAFLCSYVIVRTKGRLKSLVETWSMVPLSFPSIVFAVGFVWAFIRTPIYGTLWILLLFYVVNYLPFAIRTLSPFFFQYHSELEEASWVSGAGPFYTIRRVVLPIIRGGILAVWVIIFQVFLREFGGSMVLYAFGTEVLSVLLYSRAVYEGILAVGAVVGTIILAISLTTYALVARYIRVAI